MKHTTLYTALLGILAAYLIVAYIAYSLFWPIKTLVINNYDEAHPVKIENPDPIRPGDTLQYTLDFCKYRDDESIVHRTLVDGQIIFLQDTVGRLPVGCYKTLVTTAVVPETINSGRYYLDVAVTYKINPFRTETTHYRTNYFNVVRPTTNTTVITKTVPVIQEVKVPTPVYVPVIPPSTKEDKPDTIIINNNTPSKDSPASSQPETPKKGTIEKVLNVLPVNLKL